MCQAEHLHHLRVREWQDVHSQLRQVALGLGLTVHPLTEEPDRDGIHLALLSGLLSQVGVLDPDGREYRGAREARFTIAPGSSLGRRRPSWVMAAELVETDRLRARTVAAISPDRIERVAGHLVTRAHDEPWWDPERGAAMTTERVSLYGLPLVTGRRVAYERVDRAGARALFLRHALVDGDWTTHHAFVVANQAAVAEVLDLEDRVRRDLLVDDETLWRFFDRRVPQDITTARRFDRWWRDARLQDADLLTYRQEDLLEPGAGPIDLTGFPDTWSSGELRLPLTYVRDPGHDLDGVTVDVPLALLDRVAGAGLDWQVPGHRRELVTALLRTLPKALRRHATPAPDVAAELLDASDPADGPLVEVLATALARRTGVAVVPTDLDVAALPGWLRVTYRAVDAHGRPVAWSKDLGALRRKLRDRIQQAVAAAAPLEERTGLTAWTVGDLPREVEAVHAGHAVTAYPALVDEGAAVGLRVLATPAEQASAMWAGTRRLLLLAVGAPLRTLDRGLPNATKLALAGSAHTTAAAAYREVAEAAVDQLLLEAGGPVWDEASFSTLASQVRAGFAPTALALATTVGEIVATATRVEARLDAMVAAQLDETVVDVRTHLQRLLHAGWITAAGADRLPDVARYVRAVEHRVERAATKPDRDRARIAEVQALEHAYRAVAAHDLDGSVRWMLEELRVSTFAQSIGAKGSPSPQRLRAALDQLRREPRRP
jgi:ATP-dependent helicase HrpA